MITIRSTTGSYIGDYNGIFLDEETTVDVNNLTINGTFSYYGSVFPIGYSFTMPAPSSTLTTYVSIQISASGVITPYTSTSSLPTLQAGQVLIIYSETIPANATNDMGFTTNIEPSL